ncbi:MAG: hypothetical protein EP341_03015 [Sphingomonadales bacterium]|nr:MAG: hypothetical protein EP341_03015 [Sphingomonadales bacterium]
MKPQNAFMNALLHTKQQARPASPMTNALLGSNPAGFKPRPDPSWYRQDGSQKGRGYLGPVQNAFGQTMTEYSIGVNMDGQEVEIPTFVPGLSPEEMQFLTTTDGSQPIPQSIVNKAVDHARMRMQRGLSPWHDSGPNHTKAR